ncbi:hypothetical protein TNCV_4023021 [Trichonephila clavipes]|nr:hypothetical protein TNCV_4023021 [Trichonephila clavipes]
MKDLSVSSFLATETGRVDNVELRSPRAEASLCYLHSKADLADVRRENVTPAFASYRNIRKIFVNNDNGHKRTVLKFGKRIPFIEYRPPTKWVLSKSAPKWRSRELSGVIGN